MPKIVIFTEIKSTIDICFDLSRSIDLHQISTSKTKERAIAGKMKGIIGLAESVTWEATHFGIKQRLSSKITIFDRPQYFVDEQTKGPFKSIYHEHSFEEIGAKVIMKDSFEFQSPFGWIGEIFNFVILKRYMKGFLIARNKVIKEFAETDKWKTILNGR